MTITGKSLIAGEWTGNPATGFHSFDPVANKALAYQYADATEAEVAAAITAADQAFVSYGQLPAQKRATFLRTIGEQIVALDDELIDMACLETGLPAMRILGERGRTVGQLNLFADLLDKGEYQPVIDVADAERQPLPKPDTRLGVLPLGVVGVFAASNFPLAFSTAGGDTASALAAGCPVVMKAHSAHPGTAELVAKAINQAIQLCDLPAGVFSLIQGVNYAISTQIVTHPLVKAVGFTGSERVGMILQGQINQRPEPIPFYGELGSVNPQFLMPAKVAAEGPELASALVASLMMGNGQFCTSPGVWLVLENEDYQGFAEAAKVAIAAQPSGVMLTPEISKAYQNTTAAWQQLPQVSELGRGIGGEAHFCTPMLFTTDFSTFAQQAELQQEVFGFCALIVRCRDLAEMAQAIAVLKGNLTASIHAADKDMSVVAELLPNLAQKVGRLIYNQMPTGVEVCASMNHGGPFPASTNVRSTSVGSDAIKRFQRPICYQNLPQALLPRLLQDS